jgi:hypothetical protein
MKVILFAISGQMGKSLMSLEPGVFFRINSPCVSVAVFKKESQSFQLGYKLSSKFGRMPSNYFVFSFKNKSGI